MVRFDALAPIIDAQFTWNKPCRHVTIDEGWLPSPIKSSVNMAPKWSYNGAMSLSLSIKEVPEELAQALRERAARNHRSLQGELMHMLETTVRPKPFRASALLREIRALGFSTPDESVAMVREDRDTR